MATPPQSRAGPPGNISIPPAPAFRASGADSSATKRTSTSDSINKQSNDSEFSSASNAECARAMSFKRPRSQTPRSLLNRASLGVFGGDAFDAGASGLGAPGSQGNNSRWRRLRTTSRAAGGGGGGGGGGDDSGWSRLDPKLPQLLPAPASPSSSPIPTVPFVVLCLVCFGEFSSAGVAGPFLFFQIEDFGVGKEDESAVGFWAGIVSACFFFAQFLTSLLWASIATAHGRRIVLLVSLVGNATSLVLFGMSTNLRMAIAVRMAQGLFNGAVGVAKGAVRDLCDESNEARAMGMLGFWWGMGGIVGPILGGLLEHPADKYPSIFGFSVFLKENPYVLPCIVAAMFTASGAFLTLFIGPDGGPREGQIRLEKSQEDGDASIVASPGPAHSNIRASGSWGRAAGQRISGYFGNARPGQTDVSLSRTKTSDSSALPRTFTQQVDDETGGPPSPPVDADEEDEANDTMLTHDDGASGFDRRSVSGPHVRRLSRTTARQRGLGGGSAYGYDRRFSRNSTHTSATAAPLGQPTLRPRGPGSISTVNQYAPDFEEIGAPPRPLTWAQRFLLANDDAVHSITDLWVAAANAVEEYAEVFEDDEYMNDGEEDFPAESHAASSSDDDTMREAEDDALGYGDAPAAEEPPSHLPPLHFANMQRRMTRTRSTEASGRRQSGLYANIGVESPLLSPVGNLPTSPQPLAYERTAFDPTLAGIPESARNSMHVGQSRLPLASDRASQAGGRRGASLARIESASVVESAIAKVSLDRTPPPSLWSQLPLVFIGHYALLSFHSSTFEQVFMAFLVTPYPSGGLGLTAAHFAELIAAMMIAQVVFQFYLYPNVGPPGGKLSHLAMLRLGTSMYIVVYSLFPLLRYFIRDDDALVMTGMVLFAALRWAANICAFTAVAVLMNALCPPQYLALANGLAQTCSSACRTIGPIIGGFLAAKGIEGGFENHVWPFNYYLGFHTVGLLGFAGFLHCTLFIR
ncbi:hypothetical protein IE81DRAFT_293033 [Ceraceosorus guamensis]|uniref:Major facilitator superfamily MFS-1 n=1 Tax=Ceraceosorus guamensis TaxID=1522189 RepID=A0A316VYW1_9BASI|nr:hypothetical protein IE81DRAFT_293033 [Ceraceosorus guamensis]PWN40665.1 hypothetical protein IE81DRAFT_293033 [Ceraceosorus guamensis]